jgi:hypothetical protein
MRINEDKVYSMAGNLKAWSDRKEAGSRGHNGMGTKWSRKLQEWQRWGAHRRRETEKVEMHGSARATPTVAATNGVRSRVREQGYVPMRPTPVSAHDSRGNDLGQTKTTPAAAERCGGIARDLGYWISFLHLRPGYECLKRGVVFWCYCRLTRCTPGACKLRIMFSICMKMMMQQAVRLTRLSGLFSVRAIALLTSATAFHAFRAPFDMIFIIKESVLCEDCNNVLAEVNCAVTVLVADVLDIGSGYKGLRSTLKTSPHGMKLQLFTVPSKRRTPPAAASCLWWLIQPHLLRCASCVCYNQRRARSKKHARPSKRTTSKAVPTKPQTHANRKFRTENAAQLQ